MEARRDAQGMLQSPTDAETWEPRHPRRGPALLLHPTGSVLHLPCPGASKETEVRAAGKKAGLPLHPHPLPAEQSRSPPAASPGALPTACDGEKPLIAPCAGYRELPAHRRRFACYPTSTAAATRGEKSKCPGGAGTPDKALSGVTQPHVPARLQR